MPQPTAVVDYLHDAAKVIAQAERNGDMYTSLTVLKQVAVTCSMAAKRMEEILAQYTVERSKE